jgi:hypothetical protein
MTKKNDKKDEPKKPIFGTEEDIEILNALIEREKERRKKN